ncbi:hypothetical protein [Hymenobacter sp.]|uniref:hypothetical protein n=1 Tax=Hymenobacter sp. TaxID=1898978 RepID=UPI00286CCC5C|nr:hypothetical protein [Hymenobacter sp.]
MKKTLLWGTLGLAALGSWAFYPRAAAEPGYMIVSLRVTNSERPTLVTISPSGEETKDVLNTKTKPVRSLQAQTLAKLNELRNQGWAVAHVTSNGGYVQNANNPALSPDYFFTDNYLLEKQ